MTPKRWTQPGTSFNGSSEGISHQVDKYKGQVSQSNDCICPGEVTPFEVYDPAIGEFVIAAECSSAPTRGIETFQDFQASRSKNAFARENYGVISH